MKTVIDGVTAGIVGAITVAGWFLMLDVARGQPFATPALLGATLMHGAVDPRLVNATWTLVVVYSVIHVAAFVAFGLVAAWLISAAEREPGLMAGVLILFACFEAFFLLIIGTVSQVALETLIWWRIIMANILATGYVGSFLATASSAGRKPQTKVAGPWIACGSERERSIPT